VRRNGTQMQVQGNVYGGFRMIETILHDLRNSFQEVYESGGLYGLDTHLDKCRNQWVLRVFWRDYLHSEHQELCEIPEYGSMETLTALFAELRTLRTLANYQPTVKAA
jgi:hypothetical protein